MLRILKSLFLMAALLCAAAAHAQSCDRTGVVNSETVVYSSAPIFITGTGWQLGQEVTRLQQGAEFRVCERTRIGVLFDKRTWFRIEYGADRPTAQGWIYAGTTDLGLLDDPGAGTKTASGGGILVSAAHAQATGLPGGGLPSNMTANIIVISFSAILLGMIAKVLFDYLEERSRIVFSEVLRKMFRSIIVAPIVFLSFLQVGEFGVTNDISVYIGACLAFQNGFFWQTVLRPQQVRAA